MRLPTGFDFVRFARLFAVAAPIALTAFLTILFTTAPTTAIAAEPRSGGTIGFALEWEPNTLDPMRSQESIVDRQVGVLIFDTLLDLDPKGRIVPQMAQRIDAAPDGMWFKIQLRPGVKFHDGTAYDAAAVVAHFKRIMDPANRSLLQSPLTTTASVEASGPLEVTFKMKTPSAHFPAILTGSAGMVVSPSAVEKYGKDFESNPVGAGPFMFKEWRRGAGVTLVRNPAYWNQPAYLDSVVLRGIVDEQTRYASVKSGDVDIEQVAAARDVLDARNDKKLRVINPGSLGTNFIHVNNSAPDTSDVRVRKAMAHAIDAPALNKAINKGVFKVARTVLGSGLPGHELVDEYPAYDPALAKKLLADYGKPVKIKLSCSNAPLAILIAQAMQQMWKKVGIETEIETLETTQLVRKAIASDFQAMVFRWAGRADPDFNVYTQFHSKSATNLTKYKHPEMDRLLEAGRSTMDPNARIAIYRQINNLLSREVPYMLLWYFEPFIIHSAKVQGIVPVPDGLVRLHKVWKEN